MRRFLAAAATALMLPAIAPAQEASRAILVLDASGSMWGQIDGTAKITIAQDVINDLLTTLPENQELGLTVYGHRTKGDCADIETMVQPGANTRDAIASAVGGIQPKGKTPLSDAVIAAAKALRYTEDKATVILVSDGRETCERDPCAVGRELEAAGVDFTAHVVGFDISDPTDKAELQCLAENTGGTFRTASNAAELTTALAVVAEPEPQPVDMTFRATEGDGGSEITTTLIWDIYKDGAPLVEAAQGARTKHDLMPGSGYRVEALRPDDEAVAVADFEVIDASRTITVVFPRLLPDAELMAPDTAPVGSTVQVEWSGPNSKNDYVSVARPEDTGYDAYTYTKKGNPVSVRMPTAPGPYELRYVLGGSGRTVLARRTIELTPLDVTLEAQASAPIGSTVPVTYNGPDYKNDYIAVSRPEDNGYENYRYTSKGNPAGVQMPVVPGTYELRYIFGQDRAIAARTTIEVTPLDVTLEAPGSAVAGSTIEVAWNGPDYRSDYISVARPDDDRYETYSYTSKGNPATVKMPLAPGDYELRYVLSQRNTVVARKAITVTDVGASLDIPETARAGAPIVVNWDGPGYNNDYISVARPQDTRYENYTYARQGTPLILQMPTEPGTYEIRYIATGDGESILAKKEITLTPTEVTLSANDSAVMGGVLAVEWDGPDFKGDYIAIGRVGDDSYKTYAYTTEDSPLVIKLPEAPGEYELRYYLGQDRRIMARKPLTLTVE